MNTKVKFITPFLAVFLILCFLLACTNEDSSSSTTKISEDSSEESIEAEVVENVAPEEVIEEEELVEEEQSFEELEFKCIRVVDGDTIEIEDSHGEKYKVRYIGINTPETDEDYGDIATEVNKKLVEGKIVKLEKDVSETDKYGRILAYVFVGDIFINAVLVANGYAQVATYPPDVKYVDYFLELQQEARENGRGFWSEEYAETTEKITSNEEEIEEEAPQEEQQEQSYGISIVSLISPIRRGNQASITINTAPNVLCTITVHYKSGPSKAKGLDPKSSDGSGNCTWSWKVGTRTTPGDWKIVLKAEGIGQTETYFTVTE